MHIRKLSLAVVLAVTAVAALSVTSPALADRYCVPPNGPQQAVQIDGDNAQHLLGAEYITPATLARDGSFTTIVDTTGPGRTTIVLHSRGDGAITTYGTGSQDEKGRNCYFLTVTLTAAGRAYFAQLAAADHGKGQDGHVSLTISFAPSSAGAFTRNQDADVHHHDLPHNPHESADKTGNYFQQTIEQWFGSAGALAANGFVSSYFVTSGPGAMTVNLVIRGQHGQPDTQLGTASKAVTTGGSYSLRVNFTPQGRAALKANSMANQNTQIRITATFSPNGGPPASAQHDANVGP